MSLQKKIEYTNGNISVLNTIDNDIIDESSEFRIGSLTKEFTCILLLVLHALKIVNVNNNITEYISSRKNNLKNIKILDLMNHKAGIKEHPSYEKFKKYRNTTQVFNIIDKNENILNGTKINEYNYSNIGYLLLGKLIEKITDMSYIDALKKYVLNPLNMKNTNIGKTNIILYTDIGKKLNKSEYCEIYFAGSAGGLYSCIKDLIIFGRKSINLLNSETKEIFKKLYFCYERDDEIKTAHQGAISGGHAKMKNIYNINLEYKSTWNIELYTVFMG